LTLPASAMSSSRAMLPGIHTDRVGIFVRWLFRASQLAVLAAAFDVGALNNGPYIAMLAINSLLLLATSLPTEAAVYLGATITARSLGILVHVMIDIFVRKGVIFPTAEQCVEELVTSAILLVLQAFCACTAFQFQMCYCREKFALAMYRIVDSSSPSTAGGLSARAVTAVEGPSSPGRHSPSPRGMVEQGRVDVRLGAMRHRASSGTISPER